MSVGRRKDASLLGDIFSTPGTLSLSLLPPPLPSPLSGALETHLRFPYTRLTQPVNDGIS